MPLLDAHGAPLGGHAPQFKNHWSTVNIQLSCTVVIPSTEILLMFMMLHVLFNVFIDILVED